MVKIVFPTENDNCKKSFNRFKTYLTKKEHEFFIPNAGENDITSEALKIKLEHVFIRNNLLVR